MPTPGLHRSRPRTVPCGVSRVHRSCALALLILLLGPLSPLLSDALAQSGQRGQSSNSDHRANLHHESGNLNIAANDPDQFAWRLFAKVNRAVEPGAQQSIWETWPEQAVIYADPCKAPAWPGPDGPGFTAQHSRLLQLINRLVVGDTFDPLTADLNVQQVKVNRAFFNYLLAHDLWYQEGVIRAASTQGIDFPPEALVFKVDWARISEADKSRYHWRLVSGAEYAAALKSTFENAFGSDDSGSSGDASTGSDKPVLLGAVAFHIVSKALDKWVWTTWNHADTLGRCDYIGCHDTFGSDPAYVAPHAQMGLPYDPGVLTPAARELLDAAGLHEGWYHYRLMGTQVDFTDATGRPNLLGNAMLEPTFGNSSSCQTCHATATLSAAGDTLPFVKSQDPLQGYVGTPDPNWFYPSGSNSATPLVYQTDFMWQLATEAKSRAKAGCGPNSGTSSTAAGTR